MLIGSENKNQLKDIVSNYLLRNAEEFAAFSVHNELSQITETPLSELYTLLLNSETKIQNEILRHPLFKICLQSLSEFAINQTIFNKNKAIAHVNILEAMLFDFGILKTVKLKTDLNGKIYLPQSRLIIELTIKQHSASVSVEKNNNEIIVNGESIVFANIPYLTYYESGGMNFRIWSLKNSFLNIDSVTFPFIDNAPSDWKVKTITEENIAEWNSVIARASELITSTKQNIVAWSEVNYLVKSLIPVESFNVQRHLSCSSINAPGIVCMSYSEEEIQIAQALIHEAGHNKLFLFEFTGELIETNKDAKLKSPWRTDLRPPRGLIHGAFSFGGMAVAWRNLLDNGNLDEKSERRILGECITFKNQVVESLETLKANCKLTELGNNICNYIFNEMNTINYRKSISIQPAPKNNGLEFIDKSTHNIFEFYPELNKIYSELLNHFETNIEFQSFPDWIERMCRQGIEKYFHYAIPIYEFNRANENVSKILYAEILSSLIWRFQDYILDNQIETVRKQFDCNKTSYYLLLKLSETLSDLDVKVNYKVANTLFQFQDYFLENELKENLSASEIWKRGSPLMLFPELSSDEIFLQHYKEFINLIGIIGDIPDFEIDKISGVNTWVGSLTNSKENLKENVLLQSTLLNLKERLLSFTETDYPIWHFVIKEHLKKFEKAEFLVS